MNKKLQKGLTTAMAAAMGAGIIVPTVAFAAPVTTNGWVKSGSTWNFFKNGSKATGWVKNAGTWYFLDANGAMKTGWVKDAGTWYKLNASGAMQTGWVKDGASWYFLNASGAMQTGWVKDAGTWYYLFNSGSMAVNTTVDGWKLDGSGAGSLASVVPPVVPPVDTPVTVSSVSAIAANQIAVTFSAAPADTTKVVFAVKGSTGTAVTTTATWNSTNTVATLTSSYNLTSDTYSVDVNNNATDLGTSTVSVTQQAVAKIDITSTVLSVVPGSGINAGKGFATYKVLDQYGNDITATPLGNNINWTVGVGTLDSALTRNGVLVIDALPTMPLTTYTSAVINGYDTDDYVTTSSTLNVSMSTGTISGITLNKLTSPSNDDFNAGNTAGQWYLDYTALDASGNATSNYNLVNAGILQVNGGAFLTCNVVEDPNDSTKAAISVQVNPQYASTLVTDTQIPITILTTNGKSSTLTVTLKKAAALSSFTMSAPTSMVASGETVDIPFTAVDQNGVAITNYSNLKSLVNLTMTGGVGSNALTLVQNGDGTATLQATLPTVTGSLSSMTCYLMANVIATGKTSQITLNVQKVAAATTLTLDPSVLVPVMQQGSSQNIDFGYNYGGLSVQDQYGRTFDMTSAQTNAATNYEVIATSTAATPITLGGNTSSEAVDTTAAPVYAVGSHGISIAAANTAGTQTVNFELINTLDGHAGTALDPHTIIDQKSQTFSVVNNTDITGYTINTLSNQFAQKAIVGQTGYTNGAIQNIDSDYKQQAKVFGTLINGNKVLLAPTFNAGTTLAPNMKNTIVTSTVDSSDFLIAPDSAANGTTATTTTSDVYANAYNVLTNPTQTTGSANVTVMVNGTDGTIHTLTTKATSSNAAQVAKSINYYADTTQGLSVNNDDVTISAAALALIGTNPIIHTTAGTDTLSPLYFSATDQYGVADAPVTVYIASQSLTSGTATLTPGGVLAVPAGATGTIAVTGVTANGLAKTITLTITN